MELKHLKKCFFGYQTASVHQYITAMEEEFLTKMTERDAQTKKHEQQYQEKISHLEKELLETKQQLEAQKKQQMMAAASLSEAEHYAETLKQEAERKAQQELEEWEQQLTQKQRELDVYHKQIMEIHTLFGGLLSTMDEQAQALDQQVLAVQRACPDRNMRLFGRKQKAKE